MKTIKIPKRMNPFRVSINGKEYSYPGGTEQEVPDEVAEVIEHHQDIHEELSTPDFDNPNATSWNDLTDKPFGEETVTVNEPLNITWDGNTEGLVKVDGAPYYLLSNVVLTDEQIKSGMVTANDGEHIVLAEEWSLDYLHDDIVAVPYAYVMFVKKSVTFDGINFPAAGIYVRPEQHDGSCFMTSLTTTEPVEQTKTVVHKLDKKYLPDDVGGGGAEIIEATVSTQYNNTLELPITTGEISEKILRGQDIVIKATIEKNYETFTAFFKLVCLKNSYAMFTTSMPVHTSQGVTENRCFLSMDLADSTSVYAGYSFA